MLIEIRIVAVDLVAFLIGLGLRFGIGIGGANGAGMICSCGLQHFLHIRSPTRKTTRVIRIMAAGEVKPMGLS